MGSRRALVVGHDHVAGLGSLRPALHGLGYRTAWLRVVPAARYRTPDVEVTFPDPEPYDLVVPLGAPWPRDRITSWTGAETAFLRRAHDAGVAVLGVCAGAQLLTEALGGTTRPLGATRIGWREVRPAPGGAVGTGPWFRWNADQLVAPAGATVLARDDDGCAAYRHGRSVGLQFHPEMTAALLRDWLALGVPRGYDAADLLAAAARHEARTAAGVRDLVAAVLPPP